ncbi:MAG: DUF2950 domain-containing protein [Nitrospiraceae bacterium]|nr:MAG: DUF2950 domain-containing protein [Nitrospiraceae bacterium]
MKRGTVKFGVALIMVLLLALAAGSPAQEGGKVPQQKTFPSVEDAVKSMIDAVRSHDEKAMTAVLGPDSKDVISSGDEVADREGRERFIKAYEEKNRVEMVSDVKAVLYLGKNDWPMPIPIVKDGQGWYLDTKEAKEEILDRRIGRNELSAIQVSLAYADAQYEYACQDIDGDGLFEYAQKFESDPGRKNGLYWETKEGEEPSPLGPFIANAIEEGYGEGKPPAMPAPYYGYFYRILKAQGENAPGGAFDYVVKDKMIGGFALVAYPARYGISGIMTFIVNQDGDVYQKNLGEDTTTIAEAMKVFDPDKTWIKAEVKQK